MKAYEAKKIMNKVVLPKWEEVMYEKIKESAGKGSGALTLSNLNQTDMPPVNVWFNDSIHIGLIENGYNVWVDSDPIPNKKIWVRKIVIRWDHIEVNS